MLSLLSAIVASVIEGNIELNPDFGAREQLIGIYSNGDQSLTLNEDGTFVATGISPVTSGTWRNYDWNLTLSNTGLQNARIVTRNGHLCIAPFYGGVDGSTGILLKKENE